jgi:hypothetical protein
VKHWPASEAAVGDRLQAEPAGGATSGIDEGDVEGFIEHPSLSPVQRAPATSSAPAPAPVFLPTNRTLIAYLFGTQKEKLERSLRKYMKKRELGRYVQVALDALTSGRDPMQALGEEAGAVLRTGRLPPAAAAVDVDEAPRIVPGTNELPPASPEEAEAMDRALAEAEKAPQPDPLSGESGLDSDSEVIRTEAQSASDAAPASSDSEGSKKEGEREWERPRGRRRPVRRPVRRQPPREDSDAAAAASVAGLTTDADEDQDVEAADSMTPARGRRRRGSSGNDESENAAADANGDDHDHGDEEEDDDRGDRDVDNDDGSDQDSPDENDDEDDEDEDGEGRGRGKPVVLAVDEGELLNAITGAMADALPDTDGDGAPLRSAPPPEGVIGYKPLRGISPAWESAQLAASPGAASANEPPSEPLLLENPDGSKVLTPSAFSPLHSVAGNAYSKQRTGPYGQWNADSDSEERDDFDEASGRRGSHSKRTSGQRSDALSSRHGESNPYHGNRIMKEEDVQDGAFWRALLDEFSSSVRKSNRRGANGRGANSLLGGSRRGMPGGFSGNGRRAGGSPLVHVRTATRPTTRSRRPRHRDDSDAELSDSDTADHEEMPNSMESFMRRLRSGEITAQKPAAGSAGAVEAPSTASSTSSSDDDELLKHDVSEDISSYAPLSFRPQSRLPERSVVTVGSGRFRSGNLLSDRHGSDGSDSEGANPDLLLSRIGDADEGLSLDNADWRLHVAAMSVAQRRTAAAFHRSALLRATHAVMMELLGEAFDPATMAEVNTGASGPCADNQYPLFAFLESQRWPSSASLFDAKWVLAEVNRRLDFARPDLVLYAGPTKEDYFTAQACMNEQGTLSSELSVCLDSFMGTVLPPPQEVDPTGTADVEVKFRRSKLASYSLAAVVANMPAVYTNPTTASPWLDIRPVRYGGDPQPRDLPRFE